LWRLNGVHENEMSVGMTSACRTYRCPRGLKLGNGNGTIACSEKAQREAVASRPESQGKADMVNTKLCEAEFLSGVTSTRQRKRLTRCTGLSRHDKPGSNSPCPSWGVGTNLTGTTSIRRTGNEMATYPRRTSYLVQLRDRLKQAGERPACMATEPPYYPNARSNVRDSLYQDGAPYKPWVTATKAIRIRGRAAASYQNQTTTTAGFC
jgi:hypothetical protein